MAFVEARHASPNNTSAHIHPQRTTQPGTTWPTSHHLWNRRNP